MAEVLSQISPTSETLKSVDIRFEVNDDPFSKICVVLREIGRNPIETLKMKIFDIDHSIPTGIVTLDEEFRLLESILLEPGWKSLVILSLEFILPPVSARPIPKFPPNQSHEDKIRCQVEPHFKKLSSNQLFKFHYTIFDLQKYQW